jgi:hypothetical protein
MEVIAQKNEQDHVEAIYRKAMHVPSRTKLMARPRL